MIHSTDRILVTHQGTLPRPADLRQMVLDRAAGKPVDKAKLNERWAEATKEVVKRQLEIGIDSINDGELNKSSFSNYVRERLGGITVVPAREGDGLEQQMMFSRDLPEFGEYFKDRVDAALKAPRMLATGPVTYIGQADIQADIANFKAALEGLNVAEAYLPAVTPGTMEHWLRNQHYATDEEFLTACADAMHQEYQAIVDAGFLLQVDDPDLPDGWHIHTEMDLPQYLKFAEVRVDALNHALRGIPEDRVRFHTCWGSYHGPHKYDLPLKDIVHLILKVNAGAYSIEASNPMHDHEWEVWESVKLPTGKQLIPGVVGHCSDHIEHPQLVANRLVRYAEIVGRENIMAGTDCGLGSRVGHPNIAWNKYEAMVEGARIASRKLWS
ncbi:MAG TPA: cobalamin-independent methionine synthase II family protein [Chloroflexota bacterium]|jgi:5-methyltetrahydropteroyltriglutamate--homocysteine methyltransferase|nr:cobalamin-independent methionine synthase II family protein [Chloroflexota bacterium]